MKKSHLKNVLKHKITEEVESIVKEAIKSEDKIIIEDTLKEIRKRKKLTEKREKIDWYPKIDMNKCSNCSECLEFCPKGVYKNKKGHVEVESPFRCVIMCSKCAVICPEGAISFPENKNDYKKYIYYD